ncbi:MAG: 1-acyl-sn-glycerol-3-phosphate acyltransferase [Pleurocapsa sp. SU_196_0]|nr:1-acyl-sn-glycerol-3-phosphate acyltransferase [Pleurocapsa sp. SU_196_0]
MNLAHPDLSNAPRNYDWIHAFWWAYFRFIGVEHRNAVVIPTSGAAIIAPNHVTSIDPFGVGLPTERRMHFMAKQELFTNPVLSWYMHSGNAFPVERGKMDLGAIKTALRILQSEQLLVIFPTGTRGGDETKGGASFLALKTKGSRDSSGHLPIPERLGAKRFRFNYGAPIAPEGNRGRSHRPRLERHRSPASRGRVMPIPYLPSPIPEPQ